MKLLVDNFPPQVMDEDVSVGDVYKVCGGRGGPRFQVVMAIGGNTAYMIVFRDDGEISGLTQCGLHYLNRKEKIGRAIIQDIQIIEWFV